MTLQPMLTAADVAKILQVSKSKAYELMLDMDHLDSPRRVTEWALRDWIDSRTVTKHKRSRAARIAPVTRIEYRKTEV